MTIESAPPPPSYAARFWPLLLASTVVLVGYSYSYVLMGPTGLLVVNMFLWFAGVFAIGGRRWLLVTGLGLALAAVVLQALAIGPGSGNAVIAVAFHLFAMGLIMLMGGYVLLAIMRSSTVRADTILGGICVYLLFGVMFAISFSLVEILDPGSFSVSNAPGVVSAAMTWIPYREAASARESLGEANLLYFSFTTLTTLGYGDISPATPAARTLTSVEAVVGQLFIAILIARLVGLLPTGGQSNPQPDRQALANGES